MALGPRGVVGLTAESAPSQYQGYLITFKTADSCWQPSWFLLFRIPSAFYSSFETNQHDIQPDCQARKVQLNLGLRQSHYQLTSQKKIEETLYEIKQWI